MSASESANMIIRRAINHQQMPAWSVCEDCGEHASCVKGLCVTGVEGIEITVEKALCGPCSERPRYWSWWTIE